VRQVKSRFFWLLALAAVTAAATAFRLPRLDERPMHADEAVQAARFRTLWQQGRFVYDPDEFHGPTLAYATLPSVWIGRPESFAQSTAATYRVVPALFGVGMIVLIGLLADALGKPAALGAALLTAVSPAVVYYSRDYIHETLFVFFTLAAIVAGWRYVRSGRPAWCLACGASIGLMQATKETSAIAYLAAVAAALVSCVWSRQLHEPASQDRPPHPWRHLAAGLFAALAVAVTLLSSFFTNPRGPLDGLRTYLPWLGRARGASPHLHPWYDYLHRLAWWRVGDGPVWSEGLILALAAVGLVAALPRRGPLPRDTSRSFVRWIGVYTIVLVTVYAAIPYKTPWCLLGFLQAMTLLAGVGAVALVRLVPTLPLKGLASLLLIVAAGQLAWQAHRASFVMGADAANPYVYVHTQPDVERLAADVEELARASPDGKAMAIKLIWHDPYYWPLPWYLRGFEHVEYWTRMPDDPDAPVVLSSPQHDRALTAELDATHLMTGFYGLRPNVLVQIWVRMDLWEAHLRRLGRL